MNQNLQIKKDEPEPQVRKDSKSWKSITKDIFSGKNVKLFGKQRLSPENINFNQHNINNFRKILKILIHENDSLIKRLFETESIEKGVFGVWLCKNSQWKCNLVNQMFPVDKNQNLIFSKYSSSPKSNITSYFRQLLRKPLASNS